MGMLPTSFSSLRSLRFLDASRCNLSEDGIPSDFGESSSLQTLYLSYNNFRSLPKMPSTRLRDLYLDNCASLESITDFSYLKQVETLALANCKKLDKIQGIEEMESLRELSGCCRALINCMNKSFSKRLLQRLDYWTFPGSEIPDYFTPLKLIFPPKSNSRGLNKGTCFQADYEPVPLLRFGDPKKIIGLLLCFVVRNLPADDLGFNITVYIKRNDARPDTVLGGGFNIVFPSERHQDQTCLFYYRDDSNKWKLEQGDQISCEIKIEPLDVEIEEDGKFKFIPKYNWREVDVHKAGMHVVYDEMEQSTFIKIGDFFTHRLSPDGDCSESSSCRKRRNFRLLDHDDDDDVGDSGRVISRKKKRGSN